MDREIRRAIPLGVRVVCRGARREARPRPDAVLRPHDWRCRRPLLVIAAASDCFDSEATLLLSARSGGYRRDEGLTDFRSDGPIGFAPSNSLVQLESLRSGGI